MSPTPAPGASPLRRELSSEILQLRTSSGISLKRAAAELGVAVSTLHAWEHGQRFPSIENLEALARYYEVRPCRLLNGDCGAAASGAPP